MSALSSYCVLLVLSAAFSDTIILIGFITDLNLRFNQIEILKWMDWMITVPVIVYLTIILDVEKRYLSGEDIISLILTFLTFFIGCSIPYGSQFESYYILTSFCLIIILSTAIHIIYVSWRNMTNQINTVKMRYGTNAPPPFTNVVTVISIRKFWFSVILGILICILPIIALDVKLNVFDSYMSLAVLPLASCGIKTLYATFIIDSHVEVLNPSTFQLLIEERANESRRSFLRYVFHEVRVPLNSITLGLHLLDESRSLEESDAETINMMREATFFMTETLNDVLSIQKIEEGMLELHFERFWIRELVHTVSLSFRGQLSSKEIQLIINIDDNVPKSVLGDRFRLEHVVANFLSNAVKFSPHKGLVYLNVSYGVRSPGWVTFSVVDEGPGISLQDQKNLFVPYVQIRPGELQRGKGTGVGLAICKEIVALHNGDIGCNSPVKSPPFQEGKGCGSEFYFSILFESFSDDEMMATHTTQLLDNPQRPGLDQSLRQSYDSNSEYDTDSSENYLRRFDSNLDDLESSNVETLDSTAKSSADTRPPLHKELKTSGSTQSGTGQATRPVHLGRNWSSMTTATHISQSYSEGSGKYTSEGSGKYSIPDSIEEGDVTSLVEDMDVSEVSEGSFAVLIVDGMVWDGMVYLDIILHGYYIICSKYYDHL